MTKHKNIQNPDDYGPEDYLIFERKLFSPHTNVEDLEEICMTLAHLSTKKAQVLLEKFKKSRRAREVVWLDTAIEEGKLHYLSPMNEEEERDYLALKVMQEMEDEIIELQVQYDEEKLELGKKEIEFSAVNDLVNNGELGSDEALGFPEYIHFLQSKMDDLSKEIEIKEKILAQIKKSIKTDRYKDVDTAVMRGVHFC